VKEQLRKFLEEFDREDHGRKDSEDDSDSEGNRIEKLCMFIYSSLIWKLLLLEFWLSKET